MAGRGDCGGGETVTFSLAGRCERTGAVGAVIASASMAVAARCVAVRAGVGAVCSQSTTDPRLREALLEAMAAGLAAGDALAALVGDTPDVAYRQLAAVDAAGGSASYSGGLALGQAADVHAAGAAAAGNLLADRGVPAAMLTAFADRAGDRLLGDRLIAALQAGLAAGGEVSPVRSAGMVIAESVPWSVTDLRVDWDDDPVGRLAGLWRIWQPQAGFYVSRALRPSGRSSPPARAETAWPGDWTCRTGRRAPWCSSPAVSAKVPPRCVRALLQRAGHGRAEPGLRGRRDAGWRGVQPGRLTGKGQEGSLPRSIRRLTVASDSIGRG
jgi:uncharacterized Ntn-hydrolase superfamily protein